MLAEISVENIALIEEATLELAPGLNAITGETGAGKTLLATALQTLLGGRARAESCLLYTSPSPRDRTRSRMPSSA